MKIYKYLAAAALAVMSMTFTSCSPDNYDNATWHMWRIQVTSGDISAYGLVVPVGETSQLSLQIVPTFVNVVDPVWSVEDTSIATISADGLVTALKTGETTIEVHSEYNPEIYDTIRLVVSGGGVSISDDLIDQKDAD